MLTLLGILLIAFAQDTTIIQHHSSLIDGSKIEEFSIRWDQSLHYPDGTVNHQREIDETVEWIEIDRKRYLKRTQVFRNPDGQVTKQYNLTEAATMIPARWEDERSDGSKTHFDFYGKMVKGAYISGLLDPAVLIQREVKTAPFDSRMAGLLLASLPLQQGFIGKFPFVPLRPPIINEPEISWNVFEVTGREKVESGVLGTTEAWKVETNQSLTYWIIDEKPYVIRVSFPLRGGRSVFEIIERSSN